VIDYLLNLAESYGVLAFFLGMFVESVGIPFGSLVVDLASGTFILTGKASFLLVWGVSTLGLTLGSIVSYFIGRGGDAVFDRFYGSRRRLPAAEAVIDGSGGPDWGAGTAHARIHSPAYQRAETFLKRRGAAAVFLAQFFGPTRTWISIPAGALRMDLKVFILYTMLGGAIYCAAVIGISYGATTVLFRMKDTLLAILPLRFWVGLGIAAILLVVWWKVRKRRS